MVLKNLWERKDRFDRETSVAEKRDVGRRSRDEWKKDVDR